MREATATGGGGSRRTPAPRRARGEDGVSMVEFALIALLLFSVLFAIIDFGFLYSQNVTLRNATQQAGRFAAVGDFGDDSVCALDGSVPAETTRAVMCRLKAESGVDDPGTVRVRVALPDGYERGEPLLLCSEYAAHSVSGFFGFLLDGKVLHAKTKQRIEQVDDDELPLEAASETAHDGDWSWCT